jgi:hypothetical protein
MIKPKNSEFAHLLYVSPAPGDAFPSMSKGFPPDFTVRTSTLFYDENTGTIDGKEINSVIYQFCEDNRVDLILISPQPFQDMVCKWDWIKRLGNTGATIGFIWYDAAVYPHLVNEMSQYAYNIILDNMFFTGDMPEKNLCIWTPFDIQTKSPEYARDIDVCFLGSVDCQQREEALRFLYSKNIPVFHVGSTPWNKVHYDNWCYFMRRAKISLNFSHTRFFKDSSSQMKGRIFESMLCGAMVIENTNEQTPVFFEPDQDMVFYTTHEDLLKKIEYYLENEDERLNIAKNGYTKCIEKYTLSQWWKIVLNKLIFKNRKRISLI